MTQATHEIAQISEEISKIQVQQPKKFEISVIPHEKNCLEFINDIWNLFRQRKVSELRNRTEIFNVRF